MKTFGIKRVHELAGPVREKRSRTKNGVYDFFDDIKRTHEIAGLIYCVVALDKVEPECSVIQPEDETGKVFCSVLRNKEIN